MSSNGTRTDLDVHPDRLGWRPDPALAGLTPAQTVAAALTERARREPSAVAYYFPDEPGEYRLTAGELYERASSAAGALAAAGLRAGDRACLCLDTSPDLVAVLYGTAMAGAVAFVTEPPLTAGRRHAWLDRLRHLVTVAQPTVLVCEEALQEAARQTLTPLGVTVVSPPLRGAPLAGPPPAADPEEPLIIQFTSGTTSAAKGIVLSHRALRAAAAAIGQAAPFLRGDLVVSWLPLHHDMGLVGSTLATFLHGVPAVLIKPLSFGMRPATWLRMVHRYRGNLSPAPNFAYQLVVSRAGEMGLDGLDLSSWRAAFNGAEMIDAGTVREFIQILGPCGFHPETMRPCYGMAEVGLAATFAPVGMPPRTEKVSRAALTEAGTVTPPASERDTQEFVSCGRPVPGTTVRIADADGRDLPSGQAGRVLLACDSMMTGYLTAPGQLAGGLDNGWLDTGDLGFMLGGELFVTGRAKDVIIIAGRNYHPQPFELAAITVEGVRGAAAVGVPDAGSGTERLAVVVETRAHADAERAGQVRRAVEQAVARSTGVPPSQVVTVKPGGLPRTSSGKTQRHLVARMLTAGPPAAQSPAQVG